MKPIYVACFMLLAVIMGSAMPIKAEGTIYSSLLKQAIYVPCRKESVATHLVANFASLDPNAIPGTETWVEKNKHLTYAAYTAAGSANLYCATEFMKQGKRDDASTALYFSSAAYFDAAQNWEDGDKDKLKDLEFAWQRVAEAIDSCPSQDMCRTMKLLQREIEHYEKVMLPENATPQ